MPITINEWLVIRSCYSNDIKVEFGFKPLIETQLFQAVMVAFFQCGEIKKAQVDGLFYFVGIFPCEDNP